MKRTIITYGTFDLFHIGHLELLKRLRQLGDSLIVGVSTDEFNAQKGKKSIISFEDRAEIVSSIIYVDKVIPETSWDQKTSDILKYDVSVFGIGDDWAGKFDNLSSLCEVVYLPRTDNISSTQIKQLLSVVDPFHVEELKKALDIISNIVVRLS